MLDAMAFVVHRHSSSTSASFTKYVFADGAVCGGGGGGKSLHAKLFREAGHVVRTCCSRHVTQSQEPDT